MRAPQELSKRIPHDSVLESLVVDYFCVFFGMPRTQSLKQVGRAHPARNLHMDWGPEKEGVTS
jgi:hypothetical protein